MRSAYSTSDEPTIAHSPLGTSVRPALTAAGEVDEHRRLLAVELHDGPTAVGVVLVVEEEVAPVVTSRNDAQPLPLRGGELVPGAHARQRGLEDLHPGSILRAHRPKTSSPPATFSSRQRDQYVGEVSDPDDVATPADHRLAETLATEAGELLVAVRRDLAGWPPSVLGAEADRAANRYLLDALSRERPGDPVLSEEEFEHPGAIDRRLTSRRAWIVDPLDGTREYSNPPRTDWAVHVALAVDGIPVVGAVALPALGVTYSTAAPPPPPPPHDGPMRIVVSRTRPPAQARFLAERIGAQLLPLGSAGAKAMAVVRGEADAYLHAGGQHEWDSCAPVAVASAAGLWCSRIDGSPLRYNRADTWLPDLVIARPELADQVIARG